MIKLLLATVLTYGGDMPKQEKPYGTWESPIQADLIAQSVKNFGAVEIDNGVVYWEEMRPQEAGRTVIVSEEGDKTPEGFSASNSVHEYGGKSFTVHNGVIYFVNDKDQRIYVQKGDAVFPLTQNGMRFAEPVYSNQGLIAVAEKENEGKVENALVLVDLETGEIRPLATGEDFYASACLRFDGRKIAWLSWNLPSMPWDGTRLWVADFIDGELKNTLCVAGGDSESIFQPQWSPLGELYFISDKNGFWNLYRLKNHKINPLGSKEADFGLAQWVFGLSTYSFAEDKILCTYYQNGVSTLALLDPQTLEYSPLPLTGTHFAQIRSMNGIAAFIKGSPLSSPEVVKLDLQTRVETPLASNKKLDIDPAYISVAEPISFPSAHGRTAYGFYYPPQNKQYTGPSGTLPPLIVKIHGGPTSHATSTFNLRTQFWTSRGFAVLDVNYGGSTGYGREYRNLLNGNWGVVDVEDCEYGARYLVKKGCVDPKKLAITGGSAGGYTTLAALTFGSVFSVGASYYGVSDPALLAKKTHKFESRYLDRLIGPYPERSDLYQERSPMGNVEKLKRPVIFFQGMLDKVVPPDQAEILFEALKERHVPTQLVTYPNEKHGFKKAETIVDSLTRELAFYLGVFYGNEM
ncbi:MAG TPA: S9 family peptidase [Rhabdochlamydiaceae bacterium]|jgi:dipeptidyl aminopeptidase/acylaminoacyl peptidase